MLLTIMVGILGYMHQAYYFQIARFLFVFLRHGNSNRSEKFVAKLKSELLLKFAYPAFSSFN